jgi:hypothetical protein
MILHSTVYAEDSVSASLCGRPKVKETRKLHFIFFDLVAGEVSSVFTVFTFENVDTERIIKSVSFFCFAVYIIKV